MLNVEKCLIKEENLPIWQVFLILDRSITNEAIQAALKVYSCGTHNHCVSISNVILKIR